jgi:hypothetical protein
MSSYDYIAQSILHAHPAPKGYVVDVVTKDDSPGMVYLRLYADNINSLPDSRAQELADWLNFILKKLNNSLSVGKFTYEMSGELPQ